MKLVIFLVLLVIAVGVCASKRRTDGRWKKFKLMYGKVYADDKEDRRKYSIYKQNLREIKQHNKRYKLGLETFKKGINSFADLTEEQFEEKYNLWLPDDAITIIYDEKYGGGSDTIYDNTTVGNLDWRQFGVVTPAKDQGSCGSCWIFSAVGALESYYSKKTGNLVSLSEQNVVDCFSNSTCEGGFPETTLLWVKENGINTETDYPYQERHIACRTDNNKLLNVTFNSVVKVNDSERDLRIALNNFGPIVVSLAVTSRWRFYKSGVWYSKACQNITNHSMLIVGYGRENGLDYWLIKNSWGKYWGEGGYIKIARNKHQNYCGLTAESFYIV